MLIFQKDICLDRSVKIPAALHGKQVTGNLGEAAPYLFDLLLACYQR